jgi:cytochrome b subunit of formate dehydrogenase/nitrate/TMAO reductase-like tetraheme cytochrome c subunit
MHFQSTLSRLKRIAASFSLATAACLGLAGIATDAAAQSDTAASSTSLENATCLNCHEAKKSKIEKKDAAGGKPRALRAVPSDQFRDSVHATMQCVTCHSDIRDAAEKGSHVKNAQAKKPDCASCHEELWEQTVKRGRAAERPGLERVAKNIEAYKSSFHARPLAEDKTRPNATCDNCHNTHTFDIPAKNTPQHTQWRLSIPAMCATCHEDQLEAYNESVHAKANSNKMLADAAVCSDCHTAHAVGRTAGSPFKLTVTASCGTCHQEEYDSYKNTFHGKVTNLGYAYTAKCYDCHGSHDIRAVSDEQSPAHADNRLDTCRSCHNPKKGLPDVSPGFASFQPHGNMHDFEKYPQMWAAFRLMAALLIGTFAFFWLHTALWFYREYKDRQARGGGHAHVKLDEVPPALREKHVQRFSRTWRIAHLVFAISLMVLTITGMPLFYSEVPWARAIMSALGGPPIAGSIHRVAAVVFAGVFLWHLVYMAIILGRQWRTFEIFGPNSMVPGLQDLKDMIAMFKWFFGKGPRPVLDRWTYWEKFDYWAPFWGVTIIGVSGLVMWLPHLFGQFLPGWVFNVATIFHGEEAFLAVVFLFTVHFFNNHFRPDKFPVEIVMFTGTMSLDEFKRDHGVEYQRLVESGELEKHLVDPPSPTMVKASKLLGFVLIITGLTLLTLVGIGFFTS